MHVCRTARPTRAQPACCLLLGAQQRREAKELAWAKQLSGQHGQRCRQPAPRGCPGAARQAGSVRQSSRTPPAAWALAWNRRSGCTQTWCWNSGSGKEGSRRRPQAVTCASGTTGAVHGRVRAEPPLCAAVRAPRRAASRPARSCLIPHAALAAWHAATLSCLVPCTPSCRWGPPPGRHRRPAAHPGCASPPACPPAGPPGQASCAGMATNR